jgi:anti-sigma regulatory factor (Ser/Thr protein kinase)
MFGYRPARRRDSAAALGAQGRWSRSPMLCSGPTRELAVEFGRCDGEPYGRRLGQLDVAATPAAVRLARSYVRELVSEYFAVDRCGLGDIELMTSEMVTHAVAHARPLRGGTVRLSALAVGRFIRIEVTDGGAVHGGPWEPEDPLAAGGRGLCLIEALAIDHGTYRGGDGTTTFWFAATVRDRGTAP